MGITIVNKTITPINVVVIQLCLFQPVGYGRHMNISPGERVELDIGEMDFKQFKVYTWCGGSEETEISVNTIEAYIGGRLLLTVATMGTHSIVHHLAEHVVVDVCQLMVLHHLANEFVTGAAFERAVTKGVGFAIKNVASRAITPKKFGVCKEYFAIAVTDRVRYVYGGPTIQCGEILPGGAKLSFSKEDNGYDPVSALKNLVSQKK